MRISDWSSDVCSSDLVFPPRCLPARSAAKLLLPGQDLFMRPLVGEVVAVLDHGQQHRALALDHLYIGTAELRPAEIGRASCRDRVCQYVYISFGAVSFNKH